VEQRDGRASGHGIFFVMGLFIMGILVYFAFQSAMVVHRIELPFLRLQAETYSRFLFSDAGERELHRIENILALVDSEVARTGNYARIRTGSLKRAISNASKKTRSTTRVLACIFLGLPGSFIIARSCGMRRRLYDSRENVRISGRKGVEGFLGIAGTHLGPDEANRLREAPTAENLAEVFSAVRMKVNIPCSVAARLFPRGTRERLALLEYGKVQVVFAGEEGSTEGRRNEKGKES